MRKRLIKFLKKILGIKSPPCITIKSRFYCRGKNDFCTDEQKNAGLLQRLRVCGRQRRRMEGRGMKKRTPEEKYLKEIEDIRKAAAAVEAIKKIIRAALSKIIKMFLKKRVPTIPKLEMAKGGIIEPRPDMPIIGQREGEREEIIPLSRGENKTPFDDKITEAARMFIGEGNTAHLPQLYEIEGVDLAEAEPEQWPKKNPSIPPARDTMDAFAYACDALVKVGAAVASATAAFAKLAEAVRAYNERTAAALENYPNKRVVHLAKHAKKKRVRKKNINRIREWAERGRH